MAIDDEQEQHEKLIQLIREALRHDIDLREKYQVGEKFRFIRERLQSLLENLETIRSAENTVVAQTKDTANDQLVYVYLYNTQGLILRSWSNLLTPKVFYEYSVNRPIYSDKNNIESLIRSKANKMQHGYLTVKIDPKDILTVEVALQDALGSTLTKVREGSLSIDKLVTFTHNGIDYILSEQGELRRKE